MKRKSKISELIRESPFTQAWIAGQLGYTPASWRQVAAGFRALPPEKQALLASLLSVTPAAVAKACKKTLKNTAAGTRAVNSAATG